MHDQVYRADMYKLSASQKAKGLKGYYVKDGQIVPINVSSCVNRWGTIYLLTDEQYRQAQEIEKKVLELRAAWEQQLKLANELLESTIFYNILKAEQ